MSERLPLCEASFRALEDAYQRQWRQAYQLQQQHATRDGATSAAGVSRSAGVAAVEMQRLLSEVRQLHQRYAGISNGAQSPLTQAERHRLALLGFEVTEPSASPPLSAVSHLQSSSAALPETEKHEKESCETRQSAEVAALRLENAQLLTSLAWYRFREGAEQSINEGATAQHSAAAMLREVHQIKKANAALCSLCYEDARPPSEPATQRAVDVAIHELLATHKFPSQVRVKRMESSSRLFLVDRPVLIEFAAPGSSTLVVQDPDGLEANSDLRAYLISLYKPLLRAVNWRPPPTSGARQQYSPTGERYNQRSLAGEGLFSMSTGSPVDGVVEVLASPSPPTLMATEPSRARAEASVSRPSAAVSPLSRLTYEELLALKRATLQRLGCSKNTSPT